MNKVIMHKDCMDVAFEVYRTREYKPGEVNVKGRWINLGYTGHPWMLGLTTTIRIPKDKWDNWVDITDSYDKVRERSGLPRRNTYNT